MPKTLQNLWEEMPLSSPSKRVYGDNTAEENGVSSTYYYIKLFDANARKKCDRGAKENPTTFGKLDRSLHSLGQAIKVRNQDGVKTNAENALNDLTQQMKDFYLEQKSLLEGDETIMEPFMRLAAGLDIRIEGLAIPEQYYQDAKKIAAAGREESKKREKDIAEEEVKEEDEPLNINAIHQNQEQEAPEEVEAEPEEIETAPLDENRKNARSALEFLEKAQLLADKGSNNELKGYALDMFAMRMSIQAARNNKRGLAAAAVNPDALEKFEQTRTELKNNKMIRSYFAEFGSGDKAKFNNTDLRNLVSAGHGGAMEDDFREYVRTYPSQIPADTPRRYMPTARERIEALQDMLKLLSENKGNDYMKERRDLKMRDICREIVATRAVTEGVIRGKKSSLEKTYDPNSCIELLNGNSNAGKAFNKIFEGISTEDMVSNALKGHGGALQDIFKTKMEQQRNANGQERGAQLNAQPQAPQPKVPGA